MKRQRRRLSIVSAIAALLVAAALNPNAAGQTRTASDTLSLGIVSEIRHKEIEERYRDFVSYAARRLSVEGKIVIAPTLLDLAKLLEQRKVDFYMESPYGTYVINNVHGAAKLLLRRWQRGKAEYRSLMFTKRNGAIRRLADLRGQIIAFEDPGSSSGHFIPKFFLLKNGFKLSEKERVDANVAAAEIGYLFAYSQEKLIDLVLTNQVAAGAFSDDDYAALDDKRKPQIEVLAQTELLPRHLVSVRKDMPAALAGRLEAVLVSMHEDDGGRSILKKTGDTTKFDVLPGGEEGIRRRLLDSFYSVEKR
jgi:phosphate/phosphite/phosphonate ABC transporter binding protein